MTSVFASSARWNQPSSSEVADLNGDVVAFDAPLRIDTPGERDYYRNDGILQYVLRSLVS